ncbi:uncharacterized protein LOC127855639 [Dreissena polymorpha]|uniref:Uncharacterized protein n=1 Tax=Dreissena polymorpha TaxID=45954 RepID=A0A9D4HLA8_DREPO|nr:uncharacterized protein LOC127855639 [Dreissena polymorpha]XP_052247347.1 uncharacterized protein LOC127855639 [Dreissena polymorpha]KAH3721683.1 hypothetical protein DPMN_064630 [Dreissena polymorpha]
MGLQTSLLRGKTTSFTRCLILTSSVPEKNVTQLQHRQYISTGPSVSCATTEAKDEAPQREIEVTTVRHADICCFSLNSNISSSSSSKSSNNTHNSTINSAIAELFQMSRITQNHSVPSNEIISCHLDLTTVHTWESGLRSHQLKCSRQ